MCDIRIYRNIKSIYNQYWSDTVNINIHIDDQTSAVEIVLVEIYGLIYRLIYRLLYIG